MNEEVFYLNPNIKKYTNKIIPQFNPYIQKTKDFQNNLKNIKTEFLVRVFDNFENSQEIQKNLKNLFSINNKMEFLDFLYNTKLFQPNFHFSNLRKKNLEHFENFFCLNKMISSILSQKIRNLMIISFEKYKKRYDFQKITQNKNLKTKKTLTLIFLSSKPDYEFKDLELKKNGLIILIYPQKIEKTKLETNKNPEFLENQMEKGFLEFPILYSNSQIVDDSLYLFYLHIFIFSSIRKFQPEFCIIYCETNNIQNLINSQFFLSGDCKLFLF